MDHSTPSYTHLQIHPDPSPKSRYSLSQSQLQPLVQAAMASPNPSSTARGSRVQTNPFLNQSPAPTRRISGTTSHHGSSLLNNIDTPESHYGFQSPVNPSNYHASSIKALSSPMAMIIKPSYPMTSPLVSPRQNREKYHQTNDIDHLMLMNQILSPATTPKRRYDPLESMNVAKNQTTTSKIHPLARTTPSAAIPRAPLTSTHAKTSGNLSEGLHGKGVTWNEDIHDNGAMNRSTKNVRRKSAPLIEQTKTNSVKISRPSITIVNASSKSSKTPFAPSKTIK